MNVRPLHDYVIVRRNEKENLSAGGIFIPDTVTEKPVQGRLSRLETAGYSRQEMSYRWM
jgi:chaperonin GroES